MRVGAQLSESLEKDYIVRATTRGEILIPRTLHKRGNNPVICLINLSDHHVELENGVVLSYAEEVEPKVEPVGIKKSRGRGTGGPRGERTGNPRTFG